jgi:hypothetical protein
MMQQTYCGKGEPMIPPTINKVKNIHMMSNHWCMVESPSLVLVINDTKLLMPYVECFELGLSNTCDEGICGKEWWPQDHKEMEMHMK